jgi:hypothetical protein
MKIQMSWGGVFGKFFQRKNFVDVFSALFMAALFAVELLYCAEHVMGRNHTTEE